ncbi:MAG: FHA domain-containing protein [Sandaracinaceae bacterium]|nr:FHA domain-containing protein [Sandaracinaceae bacterium]
MLPLLIHVANQDTGVVVEAGFTRSPVRIGRNTLNDLAIDEAFVSQWHGVIRFDEASTLFLDLGSTNGTKLDGNRLHGNTEVELTPEMQLAIGPLRLTVARVALRDDQVVSRRADPFTFGGTSRPSMGFAETGTMEIGSMSPEELQNTLSKLSGSTSPSELVAMANRQRAVMERLDPLYAAFEAAKEQLDAALREAMADANAGERETRQQLLEAQYPKAFDKASSAAGSSDVPAWFESLAPGSSGEWENPVAQMERAGAVLAALATSLIALERGQSQVREDLKLEAPAGSSGLPQFDDWRALLRYLFDARADARQRIDELSRSFADIAMHQLAIVAGAQDGARALLSAISPHAIGAVSRGAIAKTSMGFGDWLIPWGAAGNYYKYVSKHLELGTGNASNEHLFGAAFQRAYHRVAGKKG